MTKRFMAVMLSVVMAAGLVACGGSSSTPATTAAPAETAAATQGGGEIQEVKLPPLRHRRPPITRLAL